MSDIDLRVALMESGRMNLMHLPPGAISWLWDRPTKQIDAAESLAVAANAHGNPVVDASLLKADQNVLLIKCEGGECFRIYPDGGFSHNDSPMDIGGCSSVLQGMQQAECPMDDNGHQAPQEGMPLMAGLGDEDDTDWGERSEPELDRQTNYDAPPWRDGDDSYDFVETTGVTDYNQKSPDGKTRKELLSIFQKTKSSEDATKARKAGATQVELKQAMEESINLNEIGYNPNHDTSQDADAGYDYERQGSGSQPYGDPSDDDGPDYDSDGFVLDEPRGGYGASLEQKFLGNFSSYDDAVKAIRQAAGPNYFPSLWFVDDHGGTRVITDSPVDEDAGNDEHMDAEPPESGVATPVGMTNLAGEPTMDESEGGLGASAMGGMGTGTPYVGDISMDANPEMENLMMSRELGEASIHMFRNESDEGLEALSAALGLDEQYHYPNTDDYDPSDQMTDVENIKLEVYDQSLDSYHDVPITVAWNVEPAEFDGQFQSYQGGADVERIDLAYPVRVNGKVYRQMDEELGSLILQTYNTQHTSLSDYITDTYADKIDVPQHKYPDSTR